MTTNHIALNKELNKSNTHSLRDFFFYGSMLYGTQRSTSDIDVLAVYDHTLGIPEEAAFENYDIHSMDEESFQRLVDNHDIKALECIMATNTQKDWGFNLNIGKLRESISKTSSNSWVKAKKKIQIDDEDTTVGLKSLYHSFRILDFGIQIAKYGKITDYNAQSEVLDKLYSRKDITWPEIESMFKGSYRELKSSFRKAAPKNQRRKP